MEQYKPETKYFPYEGGILEVDVPFNNSNRESPQPVERTPQDSDLSIKVVIANLE